METIKKSFAKNFLPVFIVSVIMGLVSALMSVIGTLGSLIALFAVPPLYIGFYGFLFNRMEDENPEISSIFNFYKSGRTFWKSFLMYNLGGLIVGAVVFIILMGMITSILMSLNSGVNVGGTIASMLAVVLLFVIASILFKLMPYLYAYNKAVEVGWSLKTSFKLSGKYMYIFLGINLLTGILSIAVAFISMGITSLSALTEFIRIAGENRDYTPSVGFFGTVIGWVLSALNMWATFTAAYMIFVREDIKRENLDDMYQNY